jgi:hypothetical protein
MERLIHRFELELAGHGEVCGRLPAGARVLYVSPVAAELWAEVPEVPLRGIGLKVRVAHTGKEVPPGEYVGTFTIEHSYGAPVPISRFVGHVYVEAKA